MGMMGGEKFCYVVDPGGGGREGGREGGRKGVVEDRHFFVYLQCAVVMTTIDCSHTQIFTIRCISNVYT